MSLKLHNLSKHFAGVKAVDGVTVEFETGKIYGLIGPNGSGKTTLTNLLSGIFPWDRGNIYTARPSLSSPLKQRAGHLPHRGREIPKLLAHEVLAYGITRTFQEVRLFEQMTVVDNLLVVLTERNVFGALFSRHKNIHEQQAKELLEQFGLWEKRGELAVNLSYGQRKLLEIARALAVDASIYLFDEPFAGLFQEMRNQVVEVLQELRTQGKCVILIEHNMELIRKLSDHVIVLDSGKLLAEGRPDTVLSRADVIEAYLGD